MQISSKADHETIQIGLSLKLTTISVRLAGYFVGAEWLTKWIVLNLLEITGKPPPREGDSHMKQTGMLVGNFEFNP